MRAPSCAALSVKATAKPFGFVLASPELKAETQCLLRSGAVGGGRCKIAAVGGQGGGKILQISKSSLTGLT